MDKHFNHKLGINDLPIYLTQTIVVATITREGAAKSWSMMRSPEIQLDVLRAGTDIRGLLDADDLLHRSVIPA
jgi:hypothetical protein